MTQAQTTTAREPATILPAESSTGVAATVNESVISNYDLDQRTALFVATSGVHPSKDELPQIRTQELRSLEDEVIEFQEAAKHKITVSNADVEKALQNISSDNHFTIEQLMGTIAQAGVAPATFLKEISAQLLWQKLVAARYGTDILVTDEQIDAAMTRLQTGADKPQFLVSEVYLSVDKPEDEAGVRASAERIVQQTKQGASFQTIASQFSQSASAATGGDIGWVLEGQLPEELDHALLGLQPGQVVGPVRAEGGYYILLLRDRREPAGSAAVKSEPPKPVDPDAALPLDRFLIPLPATADATLKERAMSLANDVRGRIHACPDLAGVAKQVPGTVYQPLGNMSPKDLEPTLRQALTATGPGEIVKPFLSAAGVELIMRCDAVAPKPGVFQMPTRDQVRQQLVTQQMSGYARSYLAELRRTAVIYSSVR
jgi:peptidyl-prolyl cis-trans isomerase SurA